ncbi:MAG: PAS domain S-box protein, partial [Planctomycetales bacterium]
MGQEQDRLNRQGQPPPEELATSEEKWRGLVTTAPDIILIINPDGTIRYINRTAQGYKVEDVIGTCSYDYVHEDHRSKQVAAVEEVLRTGEIQSVELAAYGTDKSLRWYTSRLGPYWENGNIVGVTSIATDITEHKLAELRLAEIAEKLALPLRDLDPQTRTFRLDTFSLAHMNQCGAAIRGMSIGSNDKTEVASKVVRLLYERFVDEQEQPALALVRCFETCLYEQLDDSAKEVANALSDPLAADTRCMRLLATAGDKTEWNDPQNSISHRVIPLVKNSDIKQLPMIVQLIQQLGLDSGGALQEGSEVLPDESSPRVFHIAEATGSETLLDQAGFVDRFGIKSVVGFGDVLPNGNVFIIIMFSKIPISRETA